MGSFGAFGTELPVDMGSGSKVSYQTVTGGSTADDVLRVFPDTANTITILNNTLLTQDLRVIIEPNLK